MKKRISVVLVLMLMLCMSVQVQAKETSVYSGGSLSECEIGVGISSGNILVSYSTSATERATEIGCKDIVLQEKVDGRWRDISIPSVKSSNSYSSGGSSLYTKAVKGRAYRAHCTHYADFNGTVKTLYNESDSLVFN